MTFKSLDVAMDQFRNPTIESGRFLLEVDRGEELTPLTLLIAEEVRITTMGGRMIQTTTITTTSIHITSNPAPVTTDTHTIDTATVHPEETTPIGDVRNVY